MLNNAGVVLIGFVLEENPLAYKYIENVVVAQYDLVDNQDELIHILLE